MAPKTKPNDLENGASTDEAFEKTAGNMVKNIGSALLYIEDVALLPEQEFEISDEALNSQGVKHLFGAKQLEFVDDSKRTRELIEAFFEGAKQAPKQPQEEGKTFS